MSLKNKTQNVNIERLDHLGVVAGVIKDLNIVELINARLGTYNDETLSAGETIAGMIINGLGFSNKPLSLTALFFKHCPLSILFHDGVEAEDFNRFKIGRVLDRAYDYGTELLFSDISLAVCHQEQVDTRFNSLDSTSFSLSGDYLVKPDDETVAITLSHSKDHRPDCKQVMLEMMVSQDGGIPLLGKALDGNASDNTVFKERSEQLIESFKASETPRYLIADCKLYTEKNAVNLKELPFVTRIPNNIKQVAQTIDKALAADAADNWDTLEDGRKMQTFQIEHYGIQQRWHVLSSDISQRQAIKKVDKKVTKEETAIEKQIFHLQAQRFESKEAATKAANALAKKWKYHRVHSTETAEHVSYEGKGRPKKDQTPTLTRYQVTVENVADVDKIEQMKIKEAHYIIGGNTDPEALDNQAVIKAYKQQYHVERGFRFLKDPLFFVASLFVKSPKRIMALLMVMLLSLLVYGIAERRMRASLAEQKETLPNQISQATATPTLRWIFQLLYGIHTFQMATEERQNKVVTGITPLQQKALLLFGTTVANIYQISSG